MFDLSVQSAARLVIQRKLDAGVSHLEIEQLLGCELPVEVSTQIRAEVARRFAAFVDALTLEAVA